MDGGGFCSVLWVNGEWVFVCQGQGDVFLSGMVRYIWP